MKDTVSEATEWFIRVRSSRADAETHAAWLHWIESDPTHKAAFARIQNAWTLAGEVASPAWPKPAELAAPRWNVDRYTSIGLAAAVAAAAIGLTLFVRSAGPTRIVTERGEQQSTTLPDGSQLQLGGATGVEVKFSSDRRLIQAQEGEVFYKVEPDPTRPFVVQSGPVTVTAIGTAFSVRREGGAVSVVVTEGLVDVKAAGTAEGVLAQAGQRVRFDRGQLAAGAENLEGETNAMSERGQLQFEKEPLRIVVASLNRYATKDIMLTDPQLGEMEFTGTVFEKGVADWLTAIQRLFPVRVEEDADRFVILPDR